MLLRSLPVVVLLWIGLCQSISAEAAEPVQVELVTSDGAIQLELYPDKAPKTVDNFLKYVKNGHYVGTIFHRVIDGFMIQGGGFTEDFKKKETLPPVRNEAGNQLLNQKYTIAMARTSNPHSATSQFFINTADNVALDRAGAGDGYGYAVFGNVTSGREVVDRIEKVRTRVVPDPSLPGSLMENVPEEAIVIKSAQILGERQE